MNCRLNTHALSSCRGHDPTKESLIAMVITKNPLMFQEYVCPTCDGGFIEEISE